MNVVSYGLGTAPYFNLDAGGTNTWLDWTIGAAGEIFVDQKFMGLFSLLFGAGIVLFADRAEAKGRHPFWFSLWRNFLLLVIGIMHSIIWDGDVLTVYAICAPFLILLRKKSVRTLWITGIAAILLSPVLALIAQANVGPDGAGLGEYWFSDGTSDAATEVVAHTAINDPVGIFVVGDFFSRALGMMLIGVALYRTGVPSGSKPPTVYRRMAVWGLTVGIALAAAGLIWTVVADFSPDVAAIGTIPNTIGTVPAVLGYLGILTLWNMGPESWVHRRLRACGRMALTNYLTQTILGVAILRQFDPGDLSRTWLALFMVVVWALQLAWSEPWLKRYRYGPFEWLWRSATYRSWQPLRRVDSQ